MSKDTGSEQGTADTTASSPAELFSTPTEPTSSEEPVVETAKSESETAEKVGEAEKPQVESVEAVQPITEQPVSAERKFKMPDGRELTPAEIAANPDLLEDLITTRHQFPHLQRKYVEMLEGVKETAERMKSAQAEREKSVKTVVEPPKAPTVDEWKTDLSPQVEMLMKSGVITKDDVDFAPGLVYLITHLLRDHEMLKIAARNTYEQELMPALQLAHQITETAQTESTWAQIYNRIDQVASLQNPFFSQLRDAGVRQNFIQYLTETANPELNIILGEKGVDYLASMFVAMNRDPLLMAASQANTSRTEQAQTAKKLSGGERPSGSGRGKQRIAVPNQDIQDLFGKG